MRFQACGALGQSLGLWDGLSPSSCSWSFKKSKMKQDTPFMWPQSLLSESWIHGLEELCVQGGTPETCGDVLTPSHNRKVNRACAESVKQPGMAFRSVWVALNPHLQWAYSPSHTLERHYIGLSWGPAGFDWWVMPRMPWGSFLRHSCEMDGESGDSKPSRRKGKLVDLNYIYPGLLDHWAMG